MKREDNEIEALKKNWERDPCWDIEDSEGFEEYRGELLAFRENKEAQWKDQKEKRRATLAAKICPLRSQSYKGAYDQDLHEDMSCVLEQCAWWNESNECCAIIALIRQECG